LIIIGNRVYKYIVPLVMESQLSSRAQLSVLRKIHESSSVLGVWEHEMIISIAKMGNITISPAFAAKNGDFLKFSWQLCPVGIIIMGMRTLMVDELKKNFAGVMKYIEQGEDVALQYGNRKQNIAVLIPFERYTARRKRKLGLLESKASFSIKEDFKMTDEELLISWITSWILTHFYGLFSIVGNYPKKLRA
jgi:hypothetical protein